MKNGQNLTNKLNYSTYLWYVITSDHKILVSILFNDKSFLILASIMYSPELGMPNQLGMRRAYICTKSKLTWWYNFINEGKNFDTGYLTCIYNLVY